MTRLRMDRPTAAPILGPRRESRSLLCPDIDPECAIGATGRMTTCGGIN